jgi:hypothetical protein
MANSYRRHLKQGSQYLGRIGGKLPPMWRAESADGGERSFAMSDEDSIRRAVAVGLPVIDAKLQRLDAATLDAAYGEEDGGQEEDEFDAVTCFQLDPCFWEPQHFINKTLILEHDIECDLRLASESGRLSVSWKLQPFNYPSDLWLGFRFLREGNLVRRWFLLGSSGEGQASIEEEMLNVEHKIESFVLVAAYLSSSQRSRIQLGSLVELRPLSLRLVHGDWSAPLVRRAARGQRRYTAKGNQSAEGLDG